MEYVSVVYNTWFVTSVFYFVLSSIILFVPLKTPAAVVYAGAAGGHAEGSRGNEAMAPFGFDGQVQGIPKDV